MFGCTPNPRNYYVSSLGSDLNIGSVTDPWKSLEKLSRQTFNPGDSILFDQATDLMATFH